MKITQYAVNILNILRRRSTAFTRKQAICLALIALLAFLIVEYLTSFTREFFTVIPARPVPSLNSLARQLASAELSPIQAPVGRKYVIISININSGIYFFHLPIVLLSWRRVGFEPIFLIVHSAAQQFSQPDNLTLSYLTSLDAKVLYLKSVPHYEVTTAMVAREMSGMLPDQVLRDYDYVITSDSDLYPIDYKYYSNLNDGSIRVWNADCCGQFEYEHQKYTMFPMG